MLPSISYHDPGVWTFIPFGVVLAGCFVFTMCYLPETLNRTVDEIQQLIHGPDVQVGTYTA